MGKTKGTDSPPAGQPVEYIPYPKALKLLQARLSATTEEIAAWIWMGPKEGGLAAYRNVNELKPPPRFYYDMDMGWDYLAPLMACWFRADDIASFQPADRYITGKALIERWSKQPGIQAEAFIRAKIAESRLQDIHPIIGLTWWSLDEDLPSKESALFVLAEVKAIEEQDGIIPFQAKETPSERRARLHEWLKAEQAIRGAPGALQRVARRESITRQTLSGILKNIPDVTPAKPLPRNCRFERKRLSTPPDEDDD